jgi:hypothetical protein
VYSTTVKQENKNAMATAPTQTAFTVVFWRRRPKKNMIAAPKAGKSGTRKI